MHKFYVLIFCIGLCTTTAAQVLLTDIAQATNTGDLGKNYGVAFADYDQDGWEDFYLTRRDQPNRLYRNLGNGQFEDLAEEAGLLLTADSRLAIWGDINNDGWPDLFVGNSTNQQDRLFLNNGDGTFQDISNIAGMKTQGDVMAAMFGDVNNDGLLDIYVARLLAQNALYINQGDLTFSDEVYPRGCTDTRVAMGGIFFDYDNDRDLDLYLVHDARQPSYLYENDGNGYFTDVAEATRTDLEVLGMGVDIADVNHDGYFDIFVTNLYENSLLYNNGNGTFSDIAPAWSVDDGGMGWGTVFFDYDNDSWPDLYVGNSNYGPFNNLLYRNIDGEGFNLVSEDTPLANMANTYGTATTDFNEDGWLDLFVANFNGELGNQFFKNECFQEESNNWLKIKGIGSVSNRSAIGLRVGVHIGDEYLMDEVNSGSGWSSQNSLTLHFGLGQAATVDKIMLYWPSGIVDSLTNVMVNQTLTIEEGNPVTVVATQEEDSSQNLKVFPNPASTEFQLQFDVLEDSPVQVSLFTPQGVLINQKEWLAIGGQEQRVNWSAKDLPAGLYYLRVQFEGTASSVTPIILMD